MNYYIDGYNLLFSFAPKTAFSEEKKFQKAREKLIFWVQAKIKNLKPAQTLLVFDGIMQKNTWDQVNLNFENLMIIYTAEKSADLYLLEEIAKAKTPQEITLVTNDLKLSLEARALGAKVQKTHSFLNLKKPAAVEEHPDFTDTKSNLKRLHRIFSLKLKKEKFSEEDPFSF
ncbi:MAG: NYN domain-containing protein [Parachlamydiales bacterium]|jgi:predicted RNA-binding protein with PIN domain